jgi:hypothetical protein
MSLFPLVYNRNDHHDPSKTVYYPRQFDMSPEELQALGERIKNALTCVNCESKTREILRLKAMLAKRDDQIAELKTAAKKHEEAEAKRVESEEKHAETRQVLDLTIDDLWQARHASQASLEKSANDVTWMTHADARDDDDNDADAYFPYFWAGPKKIAAEKDWPNSLAEILG